VSEGQDVPVFCSGCGRHPCIQRTWCKEPWAAVDMEQVANRSRQRRGEPDPEKIALDREIPSSSNK
jgi:hypothetical protein